MRIGYLAVTVIAALAVSDAAQAQALRYHEFGGHSYLWRNKSVQDELKLNGEQVQKIETLLRSTFNDYRQRMESLSGQPNLRDNMIELNKEMEAEVMKAVSAIVTADQMKRFDQIDLQNWGVEALLSDRVASALELTDEQKKKIREIQQSWMREWHEYTQPGPSPDPKEMFAKMKVLQQQASDRALALLTPEQLKKFSQSPDGKGETPAVFSLDKLVVAQDLGLTDEQQAKLRANSQEMQKERRQIMGFRAGLGYSQESKDKSLELEKRAWNNAIGVLNNDQTRKWKAMTGEPFEIKLAPRQPS